MIEEEQSNQQILDYFVAQYGQKVRASSRGSPDSTVFDIPATTTNESSNPMVWILPLVGIAGGGTALYILRRRAWKGKTGRRKGKAAK
jgi:cytochrome c-type biogenesis protein CcmH/NrfF